MKSMLLGMMVLAPVAALGQTVVASDADFAKAAAVGGMAEVQAGQLAVAQGGSEAKTFGQQMVSDHGKMNMELIALAKSKGIALSAGLDPSHNEMIQDLKKNTGREFDAEYLAGQVTEHQKTITLFQQEADRGADPEMKALAAKALPI